MNIDLNTSINSWSSSLKSPQAETKSKSKPDTVPREQKNENADQVMISSQARQVIAQNADPFFKLETAVQNGDLAGFIKAAKEKSGELEVNWDEVVDPGGKIAGAAYVESLVSQYKKALNTIESYYAEAHKENLSFDNPYTHIMQKYKISNSPYFRSDMTQAERDMAFHQERELLWGGHLTLGDPYALASSGGLINVEDADQIARQAARDKLDELIKARKEASNKGVTA